MYAGPIGISASSSARMVLPLSVRYVLPSLNCSSIVRGSPFGRRNRYTLPSCLSHFGIIPNASITSLASSSFILFHAVLSIVSDVEKVSGEQQRQLQIGRRKAEGVPIIPLLALILFHQDVYMGPPH